MIFPESSSLIGICKEDLKALLKGQKSYRADQIFSWIYEKGSQDFEKMTSLSKELRLYLSENFNLQRPAVSKAQISSDGTQKWLLKLKDDHEIETVHIPELTRGTLCVSSQVGCTLTCKFCHTGTQTWVRNLEPGEILGQVFVARDVFGEWPSSQNKRHISHLVFMGMGEPLYNYENISTALKILMDPRGLAFSRQKITLSTSGVIPQIEACGKDLGVRLAVSLHAVSDEVRDILVPLNKKYPLKELLKVVRAYPEFSKTDYVTFEYVMLKGVNDSERDAKELSQLLRGIPAKINLIPFNPWPGSSFECSELKVMEAFSEVLRQQGYQAPLRKTRGQDILAACGQLKSKSERIKRSKIEQSLKEK